MTFEEMYEAIKLGTKWYLSLEFQTLMIGDQILILNGEYLGCKPERIQIKQLEEYFRLYKHSIPTKNDPSRPYFRALPYAKLSEEDKAFGESRELARFRLEYYVLQEILTGKIVIPSNHWFWASSAEREFIILRSWIEKEQNQ